MSYLGQTSQSAADATFNKYMQSASNRYQSASLPDKASIMEETVYVQHAYDTFKKGETTEQDFMQVLAKTESSSASPILMIGIISLSALALYWFFSKKK